MKHLLELINKKGTINCDGLLVNVVIKDVKVSYGRTRYLVTPVSGSREVWREEVSIKE